MTALFNRRRFLQSSLTAGAVVTLAATDLAPNSQSSRAAPSAGDEFTNPRVDPGRVRWHANFAAACEASRVSGKPVLLFHMMGRLDERFC